MKFELVLFIVVLLSACTTGIQGQNTKNENGLNDVDKINELESMEMERVKIPENAAMGTFAGGCFWCIEAAIQDSPGVYEVISGYSGGDEENPIYQEVSAGKTGHLEAVQVFFDPSVISYKEVVNLFWKSIDPTDGGGQFADRGSQYMTAIFYHDDNQKEIALKTKDEIQKYYDDPILTEIIPFKNFYPAEEYHQDYYKKAELRYKLYAQGSGRKSFVEDKWGKDGEKMEQSENTDKYAEEKKSLNPLQLKVTQNSATEPAFRNQYWDNKEEGIYVDIVSGEALFSSKDKFDSGTGWPSFTKPIEKKSVVELDDGTLGMTRVEVRSKDADSHLGHLFYDGLGPEKTRYCMNSASLRFISKDKLVEEGYGQYVELFS